MGAGKEHSSPLPALVVQGAGCLEEAWLATKLAGQLQVIIWNPVAAGAVAVCSSVVQTSGSAKEKAP